MLTLITAPAAEPVQLTEAKLHARIEHSADDTLVTALIAAAREQVEHITGRRLITQTWEQVLPAFSDSMDLDVAPVASITSVKYLDSAGTEQTLSNTVYSLISESLPPRLVLKTGQSWPATYSADNAIRIRFDAGYGAASTAVPQAIRAWLLVRIASLYAQREEHADSMTEMPGRFIDGLLDPYRIHSIG
jgi:uncharacterized phiE125 gp8 family phage protein